MDPLAISDHLARIDEYIEQGQRLLNKQQVFIEELESRGEDTRIPAALKRDLEEDLTLHRADRGRLLAQLNAGTAAREGTSPGFGNLNLSI